MGHSYQSNVSEGNFSESSSPIIVLKRPVILTNDQILHLPTTPVQVLGAPGLNKAYSVLMSVFVLDNSAGAYVADTNSSVQLLYGNIAGATTAVPWVTQLTTPDRWIIQSSFTADVGTGDFANTVLGLATTIAHTENLPLKIADVFDGVADYTGGHPNNTLKVTLYYVVIDLV